MLGGAARGIWIGEIGYGRTRGMNRGIGKRRNRYGSAQSSSRDRHPVNNRVETGIAARIEVSGRVRRGFIEIVKAADVHGIRRRPENKAAAYLSFCPRRTSCEASSEPIDC